MSAPAPPRPVIAIDGPAASGKGTLARRLAAALGLPYLDTGLLYRAVARRVADEGVAAPLAASRLDMADLGRDDLRTPEIDRLASAVAADSAVRAALLARQREAAGLTGAVLDGRDIGTVVCPDAALKLFVTASPRVRAIRRLRQRAPSAEPDAAAIAAEAAALEARDRADRERAAAPLAVAPDAVVLDTSSLDADAVFRLALDLARARLAPAADRTPPLA